MYRRVGISLAALTLAACSFQPDLGRPALPTAPAYRPELAPAGGLVPAHAIGWQEFFVDPRLQSLIATALANNRDLTEAVLRIEEARANYRVQRAQSFPELDVGASVSRSRTSASQFLSTPVPGFPSVARERTQYSVTANVSAFELDFWGRVRSLNEAALATFLATEQAARSFQLSLIAEVATAYLTERELDDRIELARRTRDSRAEGLRIARLRLESGVISALDFRQTETLLRTAEAELAALERSQAQNANLLEQLVGGPLAPTLPAPQPLANQGIIQSLSAGLPSDLLANRPDILAAEQQLRAANANIGAARAAFFPNIALTGSIGFASTDLDQLVGSNGFSWNFTPSLTQPIFNAGRLRANLDLAEVRRDIAVANYERTIQTAFREVADALAGRRWLAEQIIAQQQTLEAQSERARLASLRYNNGVASYLEVLDAERERFQAEQSLIALRREQLANAVALYTALGGGIRP